MSIMIEFMKTMFVNGKGLAAWISLLLAANMVGSLLFINTLEGQVVLAALVAGHLLRRRCSPGRDSSGCSGSAMSFGSL